MQSQQVLRDINTKRDPRRGLDLKQVAKLHSRSAFATVLRIMRDKEVGAAVRLQAAEAILNRGWGKPSQTVEITHVQRLQQLSDAELIQHIQELARDVGKGVGLLPINGEFEVIK